MATDKAKYCKYCEKDVVPIVKMWNTLICPKCNRIIVSDKGIGTVG